MGNYASDQKNSRFFGLKLSRNTDADIIAFLESQGNIQAYLKELIREDIGYPKSTQEELDAFIAEKLSEAGADAKPMTGSEMAKMLDPLIDLLWPDIPHGFNNEQFAESWNRQLAAR